MEGTQCGTAATAMGRIDDFRIESAARPEMVEADGILLPTKRRAYVRTDQHRPNHSEPMVSIDLSDIYFP